MRLKLFSGLSSIVLFGLFSASCNKLESKPARALPVAQKQDHQAEEDGKMLSVDTKAVMPIPSDTNEGHQLPSPILAPSEPSSSLGISSGSGGHQEPRSLDFGDAPDTFGTSLGQDGARHELVDYKTSSYATPLMLGKTVDIDQDGFPGADANGDDINNLDEETSAIFTVVNSQPILVTVEVTNNGSRDATLAGWIDINGNGEFDIGERATQTVPENSGTNNYVLTFPPLTSDSVPSTYARLRILPGDVASPLPNGLVVGGEVEDFLVPVSRATIITTVTTDSSLSAAKLPPTILPGEVYKYTTTVTNDGAQKLAIEELLAALEDVLDDADYNNDAQATDGEVSFDAGKIDWKGELEVGQTVEIKYSVTVKNPPLGNQALKQEVKTKTLGTTCSNEINFGCSTRNPPLPVQPKFVCQNGLLLQQAPADSYGITLSTGASKLAASDFFAQSINAAGYNTRDNLVYGWVNSGPEIDRGIVRIGSDYSVNYLGYPTNWASFPGLGSSFTIGDFDAKNHLWIANTDPGVNRWVEIDLDPNSAAFNQVVKTGVFGAFPQANYQFQDWAFSPSNKQFYIIAGSIKNDNKRLWQFNPVNGSLSSLTDLGNFAKGSTFGAVFADSSNNLFGIQNQTGNLYRISLSSLASTFVATVPIKDLNDGASCVLQTSKFIAP